MKAQGLPQIAPEKTAEKARKLLQYRVVQTVDFGKLFLDAIKGIDRQVEIGRVAGQACKEENRENHDADRKEALQAAPGNEPQHLLILGCIRFISSGPLRCFRTDLPSDSVAWIRDKAFPSRARVNPALDRPHQAAINP
ncbi:hypothetical protein D9M68_926300 [compost metagenome]